jgi:translation initiation factor IF-2
MSKKKINKQQKEIMVLDFYLKDDVFFYRKLPTLYDFSKIINKSTDQLILVFKNKEKIKPKSIREILSEEQLIELCLDLEIDLKKVNELTYNRYWEEIKLIDHDHDLKKRPPIITIMGHIDHGKTTLLDKIRNSRIVDKEHGGITQHIGAYQIDFENEKITFIDTPGHLFFKKMRKRGVNITDIVILVVSAEDGIKHQTREASELALSVFVPIIVFVNKIDKLNVNPEKMERDLLKLKLISPRFGGDVNCIYGSAKTGKGVEDLLRAILEKSKSLNLKANFDRYANGVVIESHFDKKQGLVCTLLVKGGTLYLKDLIVTSSGFGRIKIIKDENGKLLNKATPSMAIQVIGLDYLPILNDQFVVFYDEKNAKKVITKESKNNHKHIVNPYVKKINELEENNREFFNIILKVDTKSSEEAILDNLNQIQQEEELKSLRILKINVGSLKEEDKELAKTVKGTVIYCYNVKVGSLLNNQLKALKIEVRIFNLIFDLIEDIKVMLIPKIEIHPSAIASIKKIFLLPNIGKIAGCFVEKGKIEVNQKVKIKRDDKIIFEDEIQSIKQKTKDIDFVNENNECGITFKNFQSFKINDLIEVYD